MTALTRLLTLALLVFVASLPTAHAQGTPVSVYMSPNGNDQDSGQSAKQAVKSLQAALDKAMQSAGKAATEVAVRVLPGTYSGQSAVIKMPAGKALRIEISRADDGTRPTFDGQGQESTWLVADGVNWRDGELKIFGLEVRNYSTAISLNGSRDVADTNVGNVTIRNNVFQSIGQLAASQATPSTAAVRLVNADRVSLINNKFIEIRNRQRCGLIHAIYIAHGSSDNVIVDNTFENACGDAIRFRDASGNNRVEGNTFIDAWADAPISDWYCDSSGRADCTKKTPECPSIGNQLSGNKIVTRSAKAPEPVKSYGPDSTTLCPLPAAPSEPARQRFLSR